MSYYRQPSRKTPYCATCERAGQPESVYRGHFTKDAPGGKVICPTIKEFKCKECGESGHIANVKYCPVLREYAASDKKVNQAKARAERVLYEQVMKDKEIEALTRRNTTTTNRFALAFDSCDSEDEGEKKKEKEKKKVVVVKEEFPMLGGGAAATAASVDSLAAAWSYRDMLEKPIVLEKEEIVSNFRVIPSSSFAKVTVTPLKFRQTRRSWADDTSSDEEED